MFWKYEDNKVVKKEPPKYPSLPKEVVETMEEVRTMREAGDGFSSSDETGAEERFKGRTDEFKAKNRPIYKHHIWWFIHNCVAHPLIGILPSKSTFDFHDWTSRKINGR